MLLAGYEIQLQWAAVNPVLSALLTLPHSDLAGMQKWCVREFDNYLIFICHTPAGSIMRWVQCSTELMESVRGRYLTRQNGLMLQGNVDKSANSLLMAAEAASYQTRVETSDFAHHFLWGKQCQQM